MGSLEDFKIYQSAIDLRKLIWKLAATFPPDEKYRLTDQIVRSTRKCPANLAEGYGRFHYQENIQYCRIARGSLTETIDHLEVASECGYISSAKQAEIKSQILLLIKMVNNYITYLRKRKSAGN